MWCDVFHIHQSKFRVASTLTQSWTWLLSARFQCVTKPSSPHFFQTPIYNQHQVTSNYTKCILWSLFLYFQIFEGSQVGPKLAGSHFLVENSLQKVKSQHPEGQLSITPARYKAAHELWIGEVNTSQPKKTLYKRKVWLTVGQDGLGRASE